MKKEKGPKIEEIAAENKGVDLKLLKESLAIFEDLKKKGVKTKTPSIRSPQNHRSERVVAEIFRPK